jgi:hypothetical protein
MDQETFTERIMAATELMEFSPTGAVEYPRGEPVHPPISNRGARIGFVQLGDIPDRGHRSFLCYKILAVVERVIGWKTIKLFGNHEMYHLSGHPCQLNAVDTANYGGEAARAALYEGALRQHFVANNRIMVRIGGPLVADGEYVVSADKMDTLFVHGGIEPMWVRRILLGAEEARTAGAYANWESMLLSFAQNEFLNEIPEHMFRGFVELTNALVRRDVANHDAQLFDADPHGPSETKRYSDASYVDAGADTGIPYTTCLEVDQVLEKLQVSRIVVGHMPQRDHRAKSKCNGKFLLTDIQMSSGFGNHGGDGLSHPGALVMRKGADGNLSRMAMHYVAGDGRPAEDLIYEA